MSADKDESVNLVWDLERERVTIGGALVLRQEGELLARLQKRSSLSVRLIVPETGRHVAERMAQIIFGGSSYPFQLVESTRCASGWPSASVRAQPDFSYFSFSRIVALQAQTGLKPRLRWSQHLRAAALQVRRQFGGQLYCVHLRSVPPFTPEESNADGEAWNVFFQRHALAGKCDFLLIGDDPLPTGLNLRSGVRRASGCANGLELAAQLALIGVSDGFLGMASGLCTAANFSETPYVIFKHPAHHTSEMARELGTSQAFEFACERQQLWRRQASAELLDQAFHLISA